MFGSVAAQGQRGIYAQIIESHPERGAKMWDQTFAEFDGVAVG
jgi:hypothetical protein